MHRTRKPIMALALCLSLAIPALAQGPLGTDVITAGSLTGAQRARIADYARQFQDDLLSEDALACQRARKQLSEPLTKDAVSLSFRRAYSDQLMGVIRPGSRSSNEHVAVNALLVAGRLATPEALDILDRALADQRVPVRYAAVAGITLTLAQINDNAPAIFGDRVADTVERLAEVVRLDPQPTVVDAAVRALVAAAKQTQYDSVSAEALRALPRALRDRLADSEKAPDFQILTAAVRATEAMRTVLFQDVNRSKTEVATDAAMLAGHQLAFIGRHLQAGHFDAPEDAPDLPGRPDALQARAAATQMLALAENIILFVNTDYLGAQPLDPWNLADAIDADDNLPARIRAEVIGPSGVLTEPPFSFDDDEFLR